MTVHQRSPWLGVGDPGGDQGTLTHRCFSYVDNYNGDIRFDNIYISTYFCQIDDRRKKLVSGHSPAQRGPALCPVWLPAPGEQSGRGGGTPGFSLCGPCSQGKRTLLPLRKAEKKTVIFPRDPMIQASEMKNVVRLVGGQAARSY